MELPCYRVLSVAVIPGLLFCRFGMTFMNWARIVLRVLFALTGSKTKNQPRHRLFSFALPMPSYQWISIFVFDPLAPSSPPSLIFSVPYVKCKLCGAETYCDGADVGILNMGDFAVAHELLRDYLKLFVGDG